MKIKMNKNVGQFFIGCSYDLGMSVIKQLPKGSFSVVDALGRPLKRRSKKNKKAEPKNNSGDGKLDPLPEAKLKEIQRLVTKRGQVGYAYQNGKGKWQHCYSCDKLTPGSYHTVEPVEESKK